MEAIKPFEWKELHNKTLKIFVGTDWSKGVDYTCITTIGKDIETGKAYVLNNEIIRSDN
jgi:predicted RNase H-related nuclease YkuK (DUF458 family)